MRYRGADVGYLYLGEKAGGAAFTHADEEVLLLFAAQAAAAIGNARAHASERRARQNLEALIETSPVGVVVFDRGGRVVSLNREARRIVAGLREPGRPVEDLLDVVVVLRADGREVSLAELPLAQQFAGAEAVRSEEIVVSVPDGRSVRMLINVTPIPAEGAVTESVVVTMQDLAPLDEIEHMRTEFLALVSHELRTPLTSIMGSATMLLGESEALDAAERHEFFRIIAEQAGHMRGLIADLLDAGRIDSGTLSVSPEPSAVADLVERARSTFLTGDAGRGVAVDLAADLPPAMADRRRIVQVLNNLLANAARHTEPSSVIRVAAARRRPGRRVLGGRRRRGRAAGTAAAPLRQARLRHGGPRPRPRDLQGARRGPRRTHPGPERGTGPGHDGHLHRPGGGARRRGGGPPGRRSFRRCPRAPACWWSTTTRTRCASCAARWRRRATRRW